MKNTDHTWNDIQGQRVELWDEEDWPNLSTYGHWRPRSDGRFIVPDYTSGSDYSGSLVNVSNHRVFEEEFEGQEWWTTVYGGYGTFAIVLDTQAAPQEALDFFLALEDYPLASEDDHSQLEWDTQVEAYEDFVRKDFINLLEKKFDREFEPSKELDRLFHELCERANEYWVNEEGSNMWIDLDPIVEKATENDVKDLP